MLDFIVNWFASFIVAGFLDFLSNSKRDFVERHQPISSYLDDDELYDLVDTKANRNNRRHSYYPQSEVDRESFDPRMDSYNQFLIRADNDSLASFSEVSFSYSNNRHTHQYSDNNSTNNSTQHIEGSKRIDVKRMGRHGYGKGKDRTDSEDDNDKHLDFTFDDDDDDMSTNDVSVSESTGINPSRHADYSSVDVVTVTYQSPKKQRKSLSPSSSRERHWKTGTWVWPWRVHNSETKGEGKGRRGRRVERYITSASAPLRKSSSEPSLQALMKHGAIRKIYTYISRDSGSNRRGGGGRQGRTRDSDVDGDSDAEYRFDDSDYDDLMYNVDEDSMLWPDEDSFGRHHSPDPGHSFRSGGRQRGSRRSMFGGISSYINPRAWTLFHWVATMSGGVLGLALVGFIYHLFKPV